MSQQDKLFALIKALTPGEKGYFAKYSRIYNAKDKPDYVRLFDFMDSMEDYDEAAILKHFKGEKFIKQLSRKKTQLRDKIIESLSVFHADRTPEVSLRRQMNVLPVLYEKAVYNDSLLVKEFEKQIKSIKKLAMSQQCLSILIELFDWEKLLIKLQDKGNKTEPEIVKLSREKEKYCRQFSLEQQLRSLYEQAHMIYLKDINILNPVHRKKIDVLIENMPSLTTEEANTLLSEKALIHYHFLTSIFHKKNGDITKGYQNAQKMIAIYKPKNHESYEAAMQYKIALCYYISTCRKAKIYDDFPSTIEKMRASYGAYIDDMRVFNTTRFQSLICWLELNNFDEALKVVEEIDEHWEELKKVIPKRRELAFCYNVAITYWFKNKLNEAIIWLSRIFNDENTEEGKRFVYDARIIQLPVYYDYEDENLSNRIESTRRILVAQNRLFEFEKMIITYFRKLIRCTNKKESFVIISNLHEKLTIHQKNNAYSPVCEAIKLWGQNKLAAIQIL